jgi:hypothetical protein
MTDKYTTSGYFKAKFSNGTLPYKFIALVDVDTTNASGDILRFGRSLTSENIITSIKVSNTAITGLSDADIGVYAEDFGEVLNVNLLADGLTFATAVARNVAKEVYNPAVENSLLSIRALENAIDTTNPKIKNNGEGVDLALTLNATPTAGGTICIEVEYI